MIIAEHPEEVAKVTKLLCSFSASGRRRSGGFGMSGVINAANQLAANEFAVNNAFVAPPQIVAPINAKQPVTYVHLVVPTTDLPYAVPPSQYERSP